MDFGFILVLQRQLSYAVFFVMIIRYMLSMVESKAPLVNLHVKQVLPHRINLN